MIQNEKGFALAISLALLPVFVGALMAGYFIIGSLHLDLSLKQVCRENGISAQKQVRPLLSALMKLNTMAKVLKIRHRAAVVFVGVCIIKTPCLPRARQELSRVNRLRDQLDEKQKQIIRQANLILKTQHQRTQWQIRKDLLKNKFSVFRILGSQVSGKAPVLAVRPNDTGTAPTYRTEERFTERQALAHRWQYRLELAKVFKPLQSQGFHFQKSCAISLKEEKSKWSVITVEGKSLSKSSLSFF